MLTRDDEIVEYKIHVTKTVEEIIPVGSVDDQNNGGFMAHTGWKIIAFVAITAVVVALGISLILAKKTEDVTSRSRHAGRRFTSDDRF